MGPVYNMGGGHSFYVFASGRVEECFQGKWGIISSLGRSGSAPWGVCGFLPKNIKLQVKPSIGCVNSAKSMFGFKVWMLWKETNFSDVTVKWEETAFFKLVDVHVYQLF